MRKGFRQLRMGAFLVLIGAAISGASFPCPANAADIPSQHDHVEYAAPGWEIRITPYGWLTSMKGVQTIRGRATSIDASFVDIVEKSDTLIGLMADFEARYGRWSLLMDAVWTKVGLGADTIRTRSPAPGIAGSVGASLGLKVQMAIVEFGATYEIARSNGLAFDVLLGGRYWRQKAELALDLSTTVDVGDLDIAGARALSRSGSIDWVDPVVGARVRYAPAPGHSFSLRGDVGGFGLGSKFSWQAIGAYGYDFGARGGATYSGVIGYRALYVNYSQGFGRSRYSFDVLQHGPIIGLSARF